MPRKTFQWRSIKTRVTLFTLAIFVISIWSLSLFASQMLREDMERLLGEQQFSTVSIVAAQVNDELDIRFKALEKVASLFTQAMQEEPAALQTMLEQRPTLQILFNGGTFITRLDGTAIADFPLPSERVGINYIDRDYIAAPLNEGRSMIGQPVISKRLKSPVFGMAQSGQVSSSCR
ncbi:hypothetical protein [Propionivibrio sp.]|uniref:hypothetical protein n=1 Tax=Propionivibrio sp. TaxID=2212460 RepID=UPI003BF396AE